MFLRILKIVVVLALIAGLGSLLLLWGLQYRSHHQFQQAEASLHLGMSREEVRATQAWREFGRES
jgi:predicted lysophospholipase L1 biosynthesis ABC-type transport system permease subunit